jgi:hypothetical protein
MVAGLQEINLVIADQINDAMFLGQSPGPDPRREIFERFGFPHPRKRVAQDRLD